MNIPPVLVHRFCPYCGAELQDKSGRCWLCHAPKSEVNPYAATTAPAPEGEIPTKFTAWDVVFTVLLGICVVLTILVGIGFAVQDQGMLIPFAIFVGPPYLITIIRGLHGVGTARQLKPSGLFLTLMVSAVATTLVVIMLAVAAVVVLFIMCITQSGGFR
jgi:hypothetical protein